MIRTLTQLCFLLFFSSFYENLFCFSRVQQCAWELPEWIYTTWIPESWKLDISVSFKDCINSMNIWTIISLCWSLFCAVNCRNLSSNSFKGKIPAELGHIINLDTLYVIFRCITSLFTYIPIYVDQLIQTLVSGICLATISQGQYH